MRMKRQREEEEEVEEKKSGMEIVWETPANPPQKQDYMFLNGRRHVWPYYFEFISHVKNRWAGKTIVDLFAEEFRGRPYDYYVSAVKCGRLQVDGEMVPVSYVVKPSQKISHFLHRHEPPVLDWDISVLQEEANVVTVYKPPTVPTLEGVEWAFVWPLTHNVSKLLNKLTILERAFDLSTCQEWLSYFFQQVHPCGQYRKNTVVGILQAEHGLAPLFPVHRLDRLVSGLLILARNASKADLFRQEIESGLVQKEYVAKVIGIFPEDEKVVDVNINYNAREGRSTVEVGDSSGGKPACTRFSRICTNGIHSVVLCKPITGRTHQIRVHLQYTGHPIANDNLYLSEHVTDCSVEGMGADRAASSSISCAKSGNDCSSKSEGNGKEDFSIDPMCTNCPNLAPKGYDGLEEGLWLHCVKYSGPGWIYECPYPDWAFFT